MTDIIEKRKKKILNTITSEKVYVPLLFLVILLLGAHIRLVNNSNLKNEIIALDPYLFLRWTKTIVETGSVPEIDYMRAYPEGFNTNQESVLLSYFQAYFFKFLNFLDPRITIVNAVSWFPVLFFILGMVVFFLLVKKVFGNKTALFSSAILCVSQGYLFRTFQSFSDKESLGMFFFYLSLLLFYFCWHNKKYNHIFGILTGACIGVLSMVWGGVSFILIIIGAYVFVNFFFNFDKTKVLRYLLLTLTMFFFMTFLTKRYGGIEHGLDVIFLSFSSLFMLGALGLGISNYLLTIFNDKTKLINKIKLPFSVVSLLFIVFGGFVIFTLLKGPGFYLELIQKMTNMLIYPFETARHTLTVVENRQPYFSQWTGELGRWFVYSLLIGAWLFMYDYLKGFSKKWYVIIPYTLLLFAIPFSRFSDTSIFNGVSGASIIFYIGSFLLFIFVIFGGYFYAFFKNKVLYNEIVNYDKKQLYVLLWFLLLMVGARGVVRLFFVFTPIASVMIGYTFTSLFYKVPKKIIYKIGVLFAFGVLFVTMFSTTYNIAKTIGPSFSPQWKAVTNWIKEETPKESVFAHWWDYGYWVQTMGERATVLDGGQPIGSWNHFFARHVLTGKTEMEALDFLYAHNVTHLLIDPSDMGKYGAYSSIGSNASYDRLSYVISFSFQGQLNNIQHFQGNYPFDESMEWTTDTYIVQGRGGVVGISIIENNGTIESATVDLIVNGQQFVKPLSCVYYEGKEYIFNDTDAYQGCFVLVPYISNKYDFLSNMAGVFMSRRGKDALWTKLYLRNYDFKHFKLVYSDDVPVAMFENKGLWGPIKIWEIIYPENMTINPEMLSYDFPEGTFWS